VDPAKVEVILNMPPPTSVKQLQTTLGHIGYYCQFIRGYVSTTTPLEQLLKKYLRFHWNSVCDKAFETLKEKLSTTPILNFPNWGVDFHVHIDAYNIVLGVILAQPGEGNMDHPIYFSS